MVISAIQNFRTALLASIVLIGWAFGGILFGHFTDHFGRSRIMMVTIAVYAIATAACAAATNIWSTQHPPPPKTLNTQHTRHTTHTTQGIDTLSFRFCVGKFLCRAFVQRLTHT